jgi:hypothetical protein
MNHHPRYVFLEPLTGDLFTTLVGCHSDETVFPPLGGDKNVTVPEERREMSPLCLILIPEPQTA